MNEIVNKFLLVGDKFMSEMHLKQPAFTYSTDHSGPFTRNKERTEKFMQTGNTEFIYRNELDKACFHHDMAYGKSKDLAKRTESDKVLRNIAFKIASDPKYDGFQRGLASMTYKFFDKKPSGRGVTAIVRLRINFIGRLLEQLRDENIIHRLETKFGVLI